VSRTVAWLAGVLVASACSQASTPVERPAPKPQAGPAGAGGHAATPEAPKGNPVLYRTTPATHFSLERQDTVALELPGGATQLQQYTRTAYLTVAIEDAPGGYHTTIRLDSLRQAVGGTVAADSVLRAEGTSWTGSLSPQGHLSALRADRASGVGDQVEAGLPALFPVLPTTGLEGATQWGDTAERALRADAFDAKERAVTRYQLVKHEGAVYTIEASTVFQRTGTGGQATQPMEMASSGTRRAVYRFSRDGGILSGEGADSAEMTITVPAVGQSVPVHQRAAWKVSRR
jgi:hypothetical protein